jgi:hypothetical protein
MNEQYIKNLIRRRSKMTGDLTDYIQEAMAAQREACAEEVINELVACELDLPTSLINHLRDKALNAEVKE